MAKRFRAKTGGAIVFDGDEHVIMTPNEHDEWARRRVKELDNIDAVVHDMATSKSEDRRES